MKIKKPKHEGTLVLPLDRRRIDPRFCLFLGLKPPETEADKKRERRKVGCDLWGPPGGGFEPSDESAKNCAQREFREETGWDLPLDEFHKVGLLEGYQARTGRSDWWRAEYLWLVHIYQAIIPWEKRESFRCGEGFVKTEWFPSYELPSGRMLESDQIWLPRILTGQHLQVKLLFDYEIDKAIKWQLTPVGFNDFGKAYR